MTDFDASAYAGAAGVTGAGAAPPRAPTDLGFAGAAGVTGVPDQGDTGGLNYSYRWWNTPNQTWQDQEQFYAEDQDFGVLYRDFIRRGTEQGWVKQDTPQKQARFALEAEKIPGFIAWAQSKGEEYAKLVGAGQGGSGFRGGGGGGGGGGVSRDQSIESAIAAISNQVGLLGLAYTSEQIRTLATKAVDDRWSNDQVVDALVAAVEWATVQEGQLKASVNDIISMGRQYLIPVSDTSAQDLALRLASGEIDQAGIRSIYNEQARSQFGFLSDQLAAGITPSAFFAPLRDAAARTLELSPADMDLMDTDVRDLLTVTDADGNKRSASLTEVEFNARKDSRYANTNQASDRMAAMGRALADAFGGL